jgi:hypothetical protein
MYIVTKQEFFMTMSVARGLSMINTRKPKAKKLTQNQLSELQLEWRQYNKRMRRNNMHSLQWNTFEDYLAYRQGKPPIRKKEEKEFTSYASSQPYERHTEKYPSLETSNTIPGACAKRESQKYTGDLIVGIATMHKSNAVPVMRGTEQAKEIASMRR